MPATIVATTVWAIRSGLRVMACGPVSVSLSSDRAAPEIAGIAISRLNPTAQVGLNPSASAVAIVKPLRLTPGSGANIWARPISRASRNVVSAGPVFPSFPRRSQTPITSKTAAVIRKPTPAAWVLLKVSLIQSMKKSFSGIKGSVATIASRPARQTDAPLEARGYIVGGQQEPACTVPDRFAVMHENRRQRPHVQHHVEEQVLLAAVRTSGQPGKELLGDHQMAVAGDG